jgi:hypothetical protein
MAGKVGCFFNESQSANFLALQHFINRLHEFCIINLSTCCDIGYLAKAMLAIANIFRIVNYKLG